MDRVNGVKLINAEFPERPNALGKFLNGLRKDLNISMFHYRNHGAGMSATYLYLKHHYLHRSTDEGRS